LVSIRWKEKRRGRSFSSESRTSRRKKRRREDRGLFLRLGKGGGGKRGEGGKVALSLNYPSRAHAARHRRGGGGDILRGKTQSKKKKKKKKKEAFALRHPLCRRGAADFLGGKGEDTARCG